MSDSRGCGSCWLWFGMGWLGGKQKEHSFNIFNYPLPFFAVYFFFPLFSLWESALPAALLLAALVLPSLKTFEAIDATVLLVTFFAIIYNFCFQSEQYRWIDSCLKSIRFTAHG